MIFIGLGLVLNPLGIKLLIRRKPESIFYYLMMAIFASEFGYMVVGAAQLGISRFAVSLNSLGLFLSARISADFWWHCLEATRHSASLAVTPPF